MISYEKLKMQVLEWEEADVLTNSLNGNDGDSTDGDLHLPFVPVNH